LLILPEFWSRMACLVAFGHLWLVGLAAIEREWLAGRLHFV
jgi:hypothetical protein